MLNSKQLEEDMKRCQSCANQSCMVKELVNYIFSFPSVEDAFKDLSTFPNDKIPDHIWKAYDYYLDKIDPEILD